MACKIVGSQRRESIKDTKLRLVSIDGDEALVFDPGTNCFEVYISNDHHAGYVLEIGGVGYEFVRSYPTKPEA